jgi:hypothetical protein
MFIVIHANPDGDNRYSIHATEEAARKVFDKFKEGAFEEDTVYLAKIENPTDFGFGPGGMYGADVIEDSTEQMEEVAQLQRAAGIKK